MVSTVTFFTSVGGKYFTVCIYKQTNSVLGFVSSLTLLTSILPNNETIINTFYTFSPFIQCISLYTGNTIIVVVWLTLGIIFKACSFINMVSRFTQNTLFILYLLTILYYTVSPFKLKWSNTFHAFIVSVLTTSLYDTFFIIAVSDEGVLAWNTSSILIYTSGFPRNTVIGWI